MQTLLVVEDDSIMHEALSSLLRLEGYDVVSVRSLDDAVKMLETCVVDGALVDFWLDGQACEPLLGELAVRGVATVLISADHEARAVADELGLPCVHKPFVVEQLLGVISGAISRRSLRKTAVSRLG